MEDRMRKSRFTEEQIIAVLKAAEAGEKGTDLSRKHGVSEQTLYRWKAKYGGMEVGEARRLKQLEDENRRLKHAVADLTPEAQAPASSPVKKMVTPAARREAVTFFREQFGLSQQRACAMVTIHRSPYAYRGRPSAECEALCCR
jgi:putative transposase